MQGYPFLLFSKGDRIGIFTDLVIEGPVISMSGYIHESDFLKRYLLEGPSEELVKVKGPKAILKIDRKDIYGIRGDQPPRNKNIEWVLTLDSIYILHDKMGSLRRVKYLFGAICG